MKPHVRASVTQNYRLLNPLNIKTGVLVAVVLVVVVVVVVVVIIIIIIIINKGDTSNTRSDWDHFKII
jgi:multisubunit Na+/H+ antiporter MnhB subunit